MSPRREPSTAGLDRFRLSGVALSAALGRLVVDPGSRSVAGLCTTLLAVASGIAVVLLARAAGHRLLMTGQPSTAPSSVVSAIHRCPPPGHPWPRARRGCRHDPSSR